MNSTSNFTWKTEWYRTNRELIGFSGEIWPGIHSSGSEYFYNKRMFLHKAISNEGEILIYAYNSHSFSNS